MLFNKITSVAIAVASIASGVTAFKYNRLSRNDSAMLIVDIQEGLFQLVHDIEPREFRHNIKAYSALGAFFDLPTVITTSAETGPNGPVPPEILADHPKAPHIKRNGEVNAWDNEDFRNAVKATGKKQLIVAGITTDVCVAFISLSLREAGYEVFVVAEASGTFDPPTAALANARMLDAGVNVLSWFAVAGELMRDWRQAPGGVEHAMQWFSGWLPNFAALFNSWVAVTTPQTA
ncbi:isochorismatase [Auriculariales sp. MPI-PUGE-AT-0066]|nr:isochorismatase [Auriculariales sp. MPI-PUGE-AT-0066]